MRIGIDIGGTFTDIVGYSDARMYYAKAPSTPDVIQGVVEGVKLMLAEAGVGPAADGLQLSHIHGTTIATNALLERKGARIAVLATLGHQDALELGRMKRRHLYDLHRAPETPGHLAPGRMRIGIDERIDGQGRIVTALDEDQVIGEVERLMTRYDIEAVAICYLNSHVNPVHEQRTAELIAGRFPDLPISLSTEVNPVFREYERVCCTAFDAYVRPKVERYVRQLAARLKDGDQRLHLMQSRGGITSARMASRRPVSMFLSGPAAGVVAGRYIGEISERANLISFDVGGTSTDVAMVRDGKLQITQEGTIGNYPLRIPMVAMETVGSGGGSIAWLDAGGGLHVGPKSAGSNPGPACYGLGGTEPTATDASIVLGYINPQYFADGNMTLDPRLSHRVIGALAQRIGMGPTDTAFGIYRILVSQMAEAIKLVTIRRGVDPRDFSLVSFGGGGGIYAAAVARLLGIREVLVPRSPGTLSAFGLLVSDFEVDKVASFILMAPSTDDIARMEATFAELEAAGERDLRAEGLGAIAIEHRRSAEMRYAGQAYELDTPVAGGHLTPAAFAALIEAFHERHQSVYGHSNRRREVEIIALRTVSVQRAPVVERAVVIGDLPAGTSQAEPVAERRAVFEATGEIDCPIYRRATLPLGTELTGAAIIEQPDTTIIIHEDQTATVDGSGNLLIQISRQDGP